MSDDEWSNKVDVRLTHVEDRLRGIETIVAVNKVSEANVDRRLTSIEDTLKRLVWLVVSSLVLAFMGYALSGSLTVG